MQEGTLVTTRCHDPDDHDMNLQRRENQKSRNSCWLHHVAGDDTFH
jgi:hypothetical protein